MPFIVFASRIDVMGDLVGELAPARKPPSKRLDEPMIGRLGSERKLATPASVLSGSA